MQLPPPPPYDRRFIQLFTEEADQAVRSKSGPLYEVMIESLPEANPDLFSSREEVEEALSLFLWPPRPIRNICLDFPHIPRHPTDYLVEGRSVNALFVDPALFMEVLARRTATKAAFMETFGGTEGIDRLKEEFVAGGEGTPDDFEDMMAGQFVRVEEASKRQYAEMMAKPESKGPDASV